ncbi:MAG: DoxX family protein [Omnitrophica bacterium RIFCSPHIGHO2_02_FULL_46_11]|nr:MAG: DoxX family protein [Omnitrophica bacterium RIFCSPLOWO2_01_FULL_45_10b]OGW85617.1 MAG: DoxX family protein [Omnitrophica bacterium RIFCSPHIGHO2_02_FULL_46_11]
MIKKLKCILRPVPQPAFASTALLLLRLIVGAAFVLHGWGKIQTPFSWMPAEAPVHIPGFFQFLAALSEFGGGIALVLGLLTPLASFGLICTMGVAVYFHAIVNKDPFVSNTGGMAYESALVYLSIFILFLAFGPGKFSLDTKVFGERR